MKVSDAIEKIRRDLADTLERLDRWFDLPVEPQTYKPRDGGWSIREVLEHITLTNHFLMIIIRKGRDKALKRYEQGKVPPGIPTSIVWPPLHNRMPFPGTVPNTWSRRETYRLKKFAPPSTISRNNASTYWMSSRQARERCIACACRCKTWGKSTCTNGFTFWCNIKNGTLFSWRRFCKNGVGKKQRKHELHRSGVRDGSRRCAYVKNPNRRAFVSFCLRWMICQKTCGGRIP